MAVHRLHVYYYILRRLWSKQKISIHIVAQRDIDKKTIRGKGRATLVGLEILFMELLE